MYLFTITTYPNEQQWEDDFQSFLEEQGWYIGVLMKNGQILGDGCITIRNEAAFTTYCLCPEKDSLDAKNANPYVIERYPKLGALCGREAEISLLGTSTDYELACSCMTPSWYVLYSNYATHESPIVCGDCGLSVPLYKFPKILGEEEYSTVLSWQKAYNACDQMFMEDIGEGSAYQRLSKPQSDLSKLGRKIGAEFEKATGRPFYYFLFRYGPARRSICPNCGVPWKLKAHKVSWIDYCCDICRLVGGKVK